MPTDAVVPVDAARPEPSACQCPPSPPPVVIDLYCSDGGFVSFKAYAHARVVRVELPPNSELVGAPGAMLALIPKIDDPALRLGWTAEMVWKGLKGGSSRFRQIKQSVK